MQDTKFFISIEIIFIRFKMSKLQSSKFPATIFFIHENRQTTFDIKLKCLECYYVYPNEKIKRHMCPILDNIKCKGFEFDYPNDAMNVL